MNKEKQEQSAHIDRAPAWEHIKTDPQGMYTGRPEGQYEVPVQDADDL